MKWIALVLVASACGASAPSPPVENHGGQGVPIPPGACPRLGGTEGTPWQSIVFPQCAAEPFETDLLVCAGAACPRPCRVTVTNPGLPATVEVVSYDSTGRWTGTRPTGVADPAVHERVATYDGKHLLAIRSVSADGEWTETLYYEGARVVRSWDGGDGTTLFRYDADRLVALEGPTGTFHLRYDTAGRLLTEDGDAPVHYTYGDTGLLASATEPSRSGENTRYTYDARRRLTGASSTFTTNVVQRRDVAITYDTADRITRIAIDADGAMSAFDYDYCE